MKEDFLHYIWKYQLYNKSDLFCTNGDKVNVLKAGFATQGAGPDFVDAQVYLNNQLWVGTVEIHLKSSDWFVHNHEVDAAYDNVVLHVVWEEDMPVFRNSNSPVSTLELKGRIPHYILQNYQQLIVQKKNWIPCEHSIEKVDASIWEHWLERLYIERLQDKIDLINELLLKTEHNWEAVLFILLAKNFGLKRNAEEFFQMSTALDYSIIQKEGKKENHLEALFLGLLGLLESDHDEAYQMELFEIFSYQKHKYQLKIPLIQAQFSRLRPPNFPTIRISQLAQLLQKNTQLFQSLMQLNTINGFYDLLTSQTSAYWETHFVFGKESKKQTKKTTNSFIDLLLINTIIPLKFSFQNHIGKNDNEVILDLIQSIPPEENAIIEHFKSKKVPVLNALHTQGLLTLKNNFCNFKKCLHCEIGLQILNKE